MNPLLYEAKNAANHYERDDLLDLIDRMAEELKSMSMDYIRKTYGVPAKRGARVKYTWAKGPASFGTVIAASRYLHVRFDGERSVYKIHPTDAGLEWIIEDATLGAAEKEDEINEVPSTAR